MMPAEQLGGPRSLSESLEFDELKRLFNLYRLANLNVRYYGCRAESYERLAWWMDLGSGAASGVALGILLLFTSPENRETGRQVAASLAGLAAFLTAMSPLTGWSAKAKRFTTLHAEYLLLFGQIESVIVKIRRDGLGEEAIGVSKLVHDVYRQINALDESKPDEKLIERENQKVRDAYPDDYVWTHL